MLTSPELGHIHERLELQSSLIMKILDITKNDNIWNKNTCLLTGGLLLDLQLSMINIQVREIPGENFTINAQLINSFKIK